ncbi:MAG: chemotaxis protein CheX [Clostridia bacterium]|nr:chemotaxis protein CheX [Clostridia bacterium]
MFTQLFGNYLLNNRIVTPPQLAEAIETKSTTRLKLGVLAINAGYMNSVQVEEVSETQTRVDKRFGDIAVEKGYLVETQVDELLSSQKKGYLLIGQALVDKGYITNSVFEQSINNYKKEYKITNDDFIYEDNNNDVISKLYDLNSFSNPENYTYYITLLFKNLIRFIGDDFTPLNSNNTTSVSTLKNVAIQKVCGDFSVLTAIEADDATYIEFASRFAKENLSIIDDYTNASVSEFLNLHNGLFTVNMSNEREIELELNPQDVFANKEANLKNAIIIPVDFVFGKVNFIIADNIV